MTAMTKLKIGDTVSFDLWSTYFFNGSFKNVKVMSILDIDDAKAYIDPVALHVSIYPSLPEGTPNRPDGYNYVKVKHQNGSISCIGIPWIREDTITAISGQFVHFVVEGGAEMRERVVQALAANNIPITSVEVK